jgi:hypothetical protein
MKTIEERFHKHCLKADCGILRSFALLLRSSVRQHRRRNVILSNKDSMRLGTNMTSGGDGGNNCQKNDSRKLRNIIKAVNCYNIRK